MPKKASFNFGANAKPRRTKSSKGRSTRGGKGKGGKSQAWRAYTSVSNAPIPD
jgi:hypothetical protein